MILEDVLLFAGGGILVCAVGQLHRQSYQSADQHFESDVSPPVTRRDGDVPDVAPWKMLRSDSPVSRAVLWRSDRSPLSWGEGGGEGGVLQSAKTPRPVQPTGTLIFL